MYGKIVVVTRDGKDGASYPMDRKSVMLGRMPECDIRIQLPSVSRQHCRLSVNAMSQVMVTNLSSVNPTRVNGKAVKAEGPIYHGDHIQVDDRFFRFEYPPTSLYMHLNKSASVKDFAAKMLEVLNNQEEEQKYESQNENIFNTVKKARKSLGALGSATPGNFTSAATKRISFAPKSISPEIIDKNLPASMPVKRGSIPASPVPSKVRKSLLRTPSAYEPLKELNESSDSRRSSSIGASGSRKRKESPRKSKSLSPKKTIVKSAHSEVVNNENLFETAVNASAIESQMSARKFITPRRSRVSIRTESPDSSLDSISVFLTPEGKTPATAKVARSTVTSAVKVTKQSPQNMSIRDNNSSSVSGKKISPASAIKRSPMQKSDSKNPSKVASPMAISPLTKKNIVSRGSVAPTPRTTNMRVELLKKTVKSSTTAADSTQKGATKKMNPEGRKSTLMGKKVASSKTPGSMTWADIAKKRLTPKIAGNGQRVVSKLIKGKRSIKIRPRQKKVRKLSHQDVTPDVLIQKPVAVVKPIVSSAEKKISTAINSPSIANSLQGVQKTTKSTPMMQKELIEKRKHLIVRSLTLADTTNSPQNISKQTNSASKTRSARFTEAAVRPSVTSKTTVKRASVKREPSVGKSPSQSELVVKRTPVSKSPAKAELSTKGTSIGKSPSKPQPTPKRTSVTKSPAKPEPTPKQTSVNRSPAKPEPTPKQTSVSKSPAKPEPILKQTSVSKSPAKPEPTSKRTSVNKSPAKPEPTSKRTSVSKSPAKPEPILKQTSVSKSPAKSKPTPERTSVSKSPAKPEPTPKRTSVNKSPAKPEPTPKRTSVNKSPAKPEPTPKRTSVNKSPAKPEPTPKRTSVSKSPAKPKPTPKRTPLSKSPAKLKESPKRASVRRSPGKSESTPKRTSAGERPSQRKSSTVQVSVTKSLEKHVATLKPESEVSSEVAAISNPKVSKTPQSADSTKRNSLGYSAKIRKSSSAERDIGIKDNGGVRKSKSMSPKNMGLRTLFKTPLNKSPRLSGISELMKTPVDQVVMTNSATEKKCESNFTSLKSTRAGKRKENGAINVKDTVDLKSNTAVQITAVEVAEMVPVKQDLTQQEMLSPSKERSKRQPKKAKSPTIIEAENITVESPVKRATRGRKIALITELSSEDGRPKKSAVKAPTPKSQEKAQRKVTRNTRNKTAQEDEPNEGTENVKRSRKGKADTHEQDEITEAVEVAPIRNTRGRRGKDVETVELNSPLGKKSQSKRKQPVSVTEGRTTPKKSKVEINEDVEMGVALPKTRRGRNLKDAEVVSFKEPVEEEPKVATSPASKPLEKVTKASNTSKKNVSRSGKAAATENIDVTAEKLSPKKSRSRGNVPVEESEIPKPKKAKAVSDASVAVEKETLNKVSPKKTRARAPAAQVDDALVMASQKKSRRNNVDHVAVESPLKASTKKTSSRAGATTDVEKKPVEDVDEKIKSKVVAKENEIQKLSPKKMRSTRKGKVDPPSETETANVEVASPAKTRSLRSRKK